MAADCVGAGCIGIVVLGGGVASSEEDSLVTGCDVNIAAVAMSAIFMDGSNNQRNQSIIGAKCRSCSFLCTSTAQKITQVSCHRSIAFPRLCARRPTPD